MKTRDYYRIGRRLALALLATAPIFAQCPTGTLYPAALDTNTSLTVAKNNLITTLTAQQQIADTVAIVTSTTGWTANMMAAVDTGTAIEYEFVTSVSGMNTLNVSRACEGSVAVIHLVGAPVDNNATAYSGHTSVAGAAIAIETALGANLANVPGSPSGGTVPVNKGGTGVATATAHGVAVGEGTSPLAFTGTGTTGQLLTSNGAAADPTYQTLSPGGALPSGSQLNYLRVQPNTGNNTTTQFASLPLVQAVDFAFPAQSCNNSAVCSAGGASGLALVVGNNTLTFTPVPQGVNGADTGHRLYVVGGVGTAEACLITGGAGTQGQASGAIIINCANTHSGAWTIQTANGGLSEAQQFLSGIGGTIVVTVPITLHAAVNGIATTPIRWVGTGNNGYVEPISRATDYPSGDMFSLNVAGAGFGWTFDSIIMKGAIGSAVTGADIHITNNTINILDVILQDSQYGLQCNGCNGTVAGLDYFQTDYSFAPVAAVFIGSGTTVSVDFFLTNMFLSGSSLGNANSMGAAVQLQGGDTVGISNSQLSGAKSGLLIDGTVAANFNVNDTFNGLQIVDNVNRGIQASGNANTCGNLTFSGLTITGDNTGVSSGTGQFYGIDWGASVATSCGNGIKISGGSITSFFAHGAFIGNSIDLENFIIFDNNKGNTAGQSGISVVAAVTNTLLAGNHVYNTAAGHQVWGVLLNGAFTGTIVGNDLSGNATGPIGAGLGTLTGVIANNKGVSDVIGTVADAATITPPLNNNYTITGSGTGITAVTMTNVPSGASGILRTTGGALTFTAGGGIGNTCTTTQNVPVPWIWDGTSLWLKC